MIRKILVISSIFVFAFAVLSISVLRSSSVTYSFKCTTPLNVVLGESSSIDYQLPYEGSVLPGSPFWPLKVMRDKVWYFISTSPAKKAELALLFADKRLASSRTLFEKKKSDLAVTTLTKGEKYLEIAVEDEAAARKKGMDTSAFLTKLAVASLKHREVMESLIPLAPEDARPFIVKTESYSKAAFISATDALNSKGLPVPINPFNGD